MKPQSTSVPNAQRYSLFWRSLFAGAIVLACTVFVWRFMVQTRNSGAKSSPLSYYGDTLKKQGSASQPPACLSSTVLLYLMPAHGNTAAIPHPEKLFASNPGNSVRFARAPKAIGIPAAGTPVTSAGAVAGRRSCDVGLDDHPVAKHLADAGAKALAAQGFPILPAGTPSHPGVPVIQLLAAQSFRPDLAYVYYQVPDPASLSHNANGSWSYTAYRGAVAVVAMNGDVIYASELSP